ncbi:hypothetical protein JJB09_02505 [Rhizobium sp. KVB221]|uniref:Uncharacterized protein n=1 Tax=Rhizobium setariae TaxID=2801340 RepID=A0A936YR96_9HYPH|nr:hypothetical protein [Rhizobium setariae]MBL0370890.1 hypothetical protein [Rhizobium setariae]
MTKKTKCAFGATAPIDLKTVKAHLDQLIDHAFATALPIARIAELMRGDPRDYARLGNLPPVAEGQLLEQAITVLASANPDVSVFADCRLPLDPDFVERIRTMPTELIGKLKAAASGQTRHHYRPDLLVINGEKGTAHLIDIKRSLDSYDAVRIAHLRRRMLAAGISLPDLLGQAGSQVVLRDIRIAVVNIEGVRPDIDRGIWSLAELDHLIGVPDAAVMIVAIRKTFARRVAAQFAAARQVLIEDAVRERVAALRRHSGTTGGGACGQRRSRPGEITIGFARLPDDGSSR